MPRVFVVHETLDREAGRTKNLRPAEKYGELVHCVKAGQQPDDLRGVLGRMREILETFTEDDFILPIGHPILIGWATALAAKKTLGKVKMLCWKNRDYVVVAADLNND